MKCYSYQLSRRYLPPVQGHVLDLGDRWVEATLKDFNQAMPKSVPLCGLLFGDIPKEANELLKAGYTHAKVKVGDLTLQEALPLLKDLQQSFRLRIDFNRKWSQQDSFELLSQVDFDYAEEPADFSFPYALDESYRDGKDAPLVIHKPSLKPETPDRPFVLSSNWESAIGIAQIASISDSILPMGLDTWRYMEEDLLEEPLYVKDGHLFFPDKLTPKMDQLTPCNLGSPILR